MRKIVYLSGTRADFGLMQSTLALLAKAADVSVAVTGTHLEAAFGNTVNEIRAAGLRICAEIPVDVLTRSPSSMSAGIGECLISLSGLLKKEQPDILLLLGDRGEMLAGAIAALHLGIVCVHIHGGERSGTVDEPVRHAISKLSSYHFVATEASGERLVRMGEAPDRIRITGAPGLDGLIETAAMPADDCAQALGIPQGHAFVLALFHPVVQQASVAYQQTNSLLKALEKIALPVVWLQPNADAGAREVVRALDNFGLPPGSCCHQHLGRPLFCAAMRHCAVMVGNSSAGIIEAASFGTPVINVGDRQHLRERNANVHDVQPDTAEIHAAIEHALGRGKGPCKNRYGDGSAGPNIVEGLLTLSIDPGVLEKSNAY